MTEPLFHLARDGQRLGALPLGEIHELLAAGFLRPTDDYWLAGQTEWRPLSDLPASSTGPPSRLLERVQTAVAGASLVLRGKAKLAAEIVSSLAERKPAYAAAPASRMLDDYLPRLRERAVASLQALQRPVESALRDEVFLRRLFGAVYDSLPKPVLRFVNEPQFIEFCLKHRQKLLG